MENYIEILGKVFTYLGIAYGVAQAIVLVTPTKKDDEALGKVVSFAQAFLELAKNIKGKK